MTQFGRFDFETFPHIESIAFFQQFAYHPVWTISTVDKVPIDMREFISTSGQTVRFRRDTSDNSMATLPEIRTLLANPANICMEFSSELTDCVVIDIEPGCPPDVRQRLESLPAYYRETSMSGKGVHLICPLPPAVKAHPLFTTRVKVQHSSTTYEVLFAHPITFTLKDAQVNTGDWSQQGLKNLTDELTSLLDTAPRYMAMSLGEESFDFSSFEDFSALDADATGESAVNPHHVAAIFDVLGIDMPTSASDGYRRYREEYRKVHGNTIPVPTPVEYALSADYTATSREIRRIIDDTDLAEFSNDVSRWEASVMAKAVALIRAMPFFAANTDMLRKIGITIEPIPDKLVQWILYKAFADNMEDMRPVFAKTPKHNTFRRSVPYLLYQSIRLWEQAKNPSD